MRNDQFIQAWRRHIALPEYRVTDVSGKSHDQHFTVECRIDALDCATTGTGRSRRKAEQIAAERAIEYIDTVTKRSAE